MKDELQNKLVEILDKMMKGVETGADFLQGELPLYLQEVLLWYGVYNFLVFIFGLILLSVPLAIFKYYPKKPDSGEGGFFWESRMSGDYSIGFGVMPAGFIGALFALFGLINTNLTWLKIWIAPKVWLVEYIGKLVN